MMRSEGELTVTMLLREEEQWTEGVVLSRAADARKLAEAVILQCIEDLWDPAFSDESRQFFLSKEFSIWAEIAGLSFPQQMKLVRVVTGNDRPSLFHDNKKEGISNGTKNTGR